MTKNFKKFKKGKLKKFKLKTEFLTLGTLGLKSIQSGLINSYQLTAAKHIMLKKLKKKGKVWIKILPHLPITSKTTGARMGKGKGAISHWSAWVSAGTVIFEICAFNVTVGKDALKSASEKLSVRTKIIHE